MSEPAISIENLSVSYGGRKVINSINASVPEHGCTVFVGPNGAGKTTLLLAIMGEIPYTGRIHLATGMSGHVAYVPQSLRFDPQTPISVGEFLAMGIQRRPLWLGRSSRSSQSIRDILGIVGMESQFLSRLGDLSGGEMRRILLAQALLRNPRLLILDEPAAGVDLRGEHLFWDILEEARTSRSMTIVMVSHNLPLTAHYATHVLCLSDGVCEEGAPHTILTARNLMRVFGIPIHLYPDQCTQPQALCPRCGAFGMENADASAEEACRSCRLTHEGVSLQNRMPTAAASGREDVCTCGKGCQHA